MANRYFSDKVVEWYQENHRKLPWRETIDPYHVWLSEVILQQTRVSQGLPYYLRFVGQYPTIGDLAAAREQDVLRIWQGLGYYSRARNMLKCARIVVADHGGFFPRTASELKALPGIGQYTAAAVASISFNERIAVLDGNVYRLLARFFGIELDIATSVARRYFGELANRLVDQSVPGVYNQAVMEFGATCCTPKSPGCTECVLSLKCHAARDGRQAVLPIKSGKKAARKRYFYYFVIDDKSRIGMKKRSGKDIWQNLYDFYLLETTRPRSVHLLLQDDPVLKKVTRGNPAVGISGIYEHILSHQRIVARFITISLLRPPRKTLKELRFYTRKGMDRLPKPKLITRYLADRNIL